MKRDPWLAGGAVIVAVFVAYWLLEPVPGESAAGLVNPLARTAGLVVPVVAAAALGCRLLPPGPLVRVVRWVVVGTAAAWSGLAGSAMAYWSGILYCGHGNHGPCSTTATVRLLGLVLILATWVAGRAVDHRPH